MEATNGYSLVEAENDIWYDIASGYGLCVAFSITRAKNKLKIYWSPETEQSVLERLEVKNSTKDAHLLSRLSSLTMTN